MDNLGAILGPLLGIALVAAAGVRGAILLSIIPGLLAVHAIRAAKLPKVGERQPIRIQFRPVIKGRLGRLLVAVSAFELGNIAATLLILRATELLTPGHGQDSAAQLALALYTAYNIAATAVSIPAGHHGDRRSPVYVLVGGTAAFATAYLALTGASLPILAIGFVLAGIGIGCIETAEHAAVAHLAPEGLPGSAFGLRATVQSLGNFAASAIAGLLWTVVSPTAAFIYAGAWMLIALIAFTATRATHT